MSLRSKVKLTREESAFFLVGDPDSEIEINNPFVGRTEEEIADPVAFYCKQMLKPENFYFTCKYILNAQPAPFQLAIIKELWDRPFPMLIASRGGGKSWVLALYSVLKAFLNQGCTVILVGAVFRQAKYIFEYCERIYNNAPILRELTNSDDRQGVYRDQDRHTLHIGQSKIVAIPMGDGTTIRGMRANVVVADEFAFLNADVYETVVEGFTATNQDPITQMRKSAMFDIMVKAGEITDAQRRLLEDEAGNQSIIAGTAEFQMNHFYDYWRKYVGTIRSRGNEVKLREAMRGKDMLEGYDWRDFSVIRIPHDLIPRGLLAAKTIARAKATLTEANFLKEYAACFPRDSQGYFPRSLLESCTTKLPIETPLSGRVQFNASLKGYVDRNYVIGVDPASESDNFAIVVLECWPDHRRILYSWVTKRKKHKQNFEDGKTDEYDYWAYCSRKLRTLMQLYPNVTRIGIDKQGGGIAILEALGRPENLKPGEIPIYPIPDPDPKKYKMTDGMPGLHIVEEINFSKEDWRMQANQGMKFDFETKTLLFPYFDPSMVVEAMYQDQHRKTKNSNLTYESLEECILDIEELKDELTTIIQTSTETGKDKWSTPEIKLEGGKKGRLTKDRYSALLIANMIARQAAQAPPPPDYDNIGAGVAHTMYRRDKPSGQDKLYTGNEWYDQGMKAIFQAQENLMGY